MRQMHIVVDGRVFDTEAAERGMGRYVDHLALLLVSAGHTVTLLLPGLHAAVARTRPGIVIRQLPQHYDPMIQTVSLNRLLADVDATAYVDATPFLAPMRYDIHACPVIAVLYDLIPLRFPNDYFAPADEGSLDAYINGLARVRKADHVITISRVVQGYALRYLGIPTARIDVIEPCVASEYVRAASDIRDAGAADGGIVCIQGAHRSKNFPAAIPFLERLSLETRTDVDIIVPTRTQRSLVDGVRRRQLTGVRIVDSIPEERKFALQQSARAILHLSLEEGYGIPLAEALLLKRPVVCLDNAINREVVAGHDDPLEAGVLLIDEPRLESDAVVQRAARFIESANRSDFAVHRSKIVETLLAKQAAVPSTLARALDLAIAHYESWHARSDMAIVAPTEFGTCGVSDYCLALMRNGAPRYAFLLGPAPRVLQLAPQLRLLPAALLDDARQRAPNVLFNLAVSDSLTPAFDDIALRSALGDVLVIHDAGSYLPGLMMQAAATGDRRLLRERYLRDEPADVCALSERWLNDPPADWARSDAMFLEIDRRFCSAWLRNFRGGIVSHHAAFDRATEDTAGVLTLLPADSEILRRAHYAPMPIDARANPAAVRLAQKFRWTLGLARRDLLVCCAGSVVGGKHLDVVARVVARLNVERDAARVPGALMLLLAGRVLDDAVFAKVRTEFVSRDIPTKVVQIVENDEARYDAMLLASDVVISFREQRRIQMSHSYVRALALGRPMITNSGAGFDDVDAAVVCRDEALEEDLHAHMTELADSASSRSRLAAMSQARYRRSHTVDAFFSRMKELHVDAAAL